jgi:hypothetical protein
MTDASLLTPARDEAEQLYVFRLRWALELGYGVPEAERIAAARFDMHELAELIEERGCPLASAHRILRDV